MVLLVAEDVGPPYTGHNTPENGGPRDLLIKLPLDPARVNPMSSLSRSSHRRDTKFFRGTPPSKLFLIVSFISDNAGWRAGVKGQGSVVLGENSVGTLCYTSDNRLATMVGGRGIRHMVRLGHLRSSRRRCFDPG